MTFLTVLLWVLGLILLVLAAILFLPIGVKLSFKDDLILKAYFGGIKLYELKPKEEHKKTKEPKEEKKDKPSKDKGENPAKKIFSRLKEKYGFVGTIKKLASLLKDCLFHLKYALSHITFEKIKLELVYGGSDAADTAIKYGEICAAVYPLLSLLDTASNVKFKKIDIESDFKEQKTEFAFFASVKTRIIFLLIAAFRLYKTYKNFLRKEDLQ